MVYDRDRARDRPGTCSPVRGSGAELRHVELEPPPVQPRLLRETTGHEPFRGARPHTVGYTGGCDQEEEEIEALLHPHEPHRLHARPWG